MEEKVWIVKYKLRIVRLAQKKSQNSELISFNSDFFSQNYKKKVWIMRLKSYNYFYLEQKWASIDSQH